MRSSVDLPEPEGPSRATISPGNNGQIGRRDDLDAVLAGLRVVLFDLLGANNRFGHRASKACNARLDCSPRARLRRPMRHGLGDAWHASAEGT